MTKLLAFVVVLALVSPLVFAEDPLCCSTTSYSDVWTYCNSAAGNLFIFLVVFCLFFCLFFNVLFRLVEHELMPHLCFLPMY